MRKIVTSNICPPIPVRQYDWCAHYDGEEEAGGYGYGATESDAIDDFVENHQADHDRRLNDKSPNPFLQGTWKPHIGWADDMGNMNAETLRKHPNWCEVTGPNGLSINGHFGIEIARIIAAAPDLLGACKHALTLLEPFDSQDLSLGLGSEALAPLRDAIAKAGGR